ncbi:transmembrane protein 132E [Patella vulgata]|uniref:transmembrane protein 132E n=1 Tax=Patella vulgata TaxID=6465 RepID=UPI0024A84B60|nr:transmembrane protein 132E [Patella vulgata]
MDVNGIMPKSGIITLLAAFVCVSVGCANAVEIAFDQPNDGYFLKSAYHKLKPSNPTQERELFVVTKRAELHKLRASHGPFEVYQAVPDEYLDRNTNTKSQSQIFHNLDVSVHLLTEELLPKWPQLQVLMHSQPVSEHLKVDDFRETVFDERWCGQLIVQHLDQRLTDVCILNQKDKNACVMDISIPIEWWHHNKSNIDVYYQVSRVEDNHECASESNSIVPGRSDDSKDKNLLAVIPLSTEDHRFDEKGDNRLIFRIPKTKYLPGSRFLVPVYLAANSEVQIVVVQAKVKNGLKIRGAAVKPNSPWSVYFEMKDRQKSAIVTAFIKNKPKFIQSTSNEQIFSWEFEVEEEAHGPETGRIIWNIDYEKNRPTVKQHDSRVTARIQIVSDDQKKIIPVFKEYNILNTAVLTGNRLSYPLKIYSVDKQGTLHDVTYMTVCHSADIEVIKVSPDCSEVYLNGDETQGSHNVTIIAKTGYYTSFLHIQVWVPENRLDIQLSDHKLSQIRTWKVPDEKKKSKKSKRSSKLSQGVDSNFLLDIKSSEKTNQHGCRLRVQQSKVEVYARFIIQSASRTDFFHNRKAYLRVTDLVRDRLRIADSRVATLNGTVIQGLRQGRTEVQVLAPSGHIKGVRELRVGKDKVIIERLLVRVISGVSLEIMKDRNQMESLSAVAHLQDKLVTKHQEGILDITLQFSDGTSFPIKYIPENEYDLSITSLNSQVVEIPGDSPNHKYSIIANNEGRGELVRVILKMKDPCMKKRSRSLGTSYVYVNVDFSKETNYLELQSDSNYDNRASDRWDKNDLPNKNTYKDHYSSKDEYFKYQHKTKNEKFPRIMGNEPQVIPVHIALDKLPESQPKSSQPKTEAQQQPIKDKDGLSPLEIGMYVLLAVFCVAILVFTVNCAVFMMRYRRKRMPSKFGKVKKGESVRQANDWVWIGRQTLERNAVNTKCSHTLMPEEDFNGNRMIRPTSSGIGSSVSSNSTGGSNRNSTVSTYKGSECSIRITANPLPDTGPEHSMQDDPEWDYEAMGMTYDQLMDYFDNLKESTA